MGLLLGQQTDSSTASPVSVRSRFFISPWSNWSTNVNSFHVLLPRHISSSRKPYANRHFRWDVRGCTRHGWQSWCGDRISDVSTRNILACEVTDLLDEDRIKLLWIDCYSARLRESNDGCRSSLSRPLFPSDIHLTHVIQLVYSHMLISAN